MQHRRKPSSYKKPHKKGCKHRYEPDSKGVRRCVYCDKPPKPRLKRMDPKDKVRVAALTKGRMPPPPRGH